MNDLHAAHVKFLNKKLGWTYGSSPGDKCTYWVTDGNNEQFVAIADPGSANGWTNNDTWEDFQNVVIAYKKIPYPLFKT